MIHTLKAHSKPSSSPLASVITDVRLYEVAERRPNPLPRPNSNCMFSRNNQSEYQGHSHNNGSPVVSYDPGIHREIPWHSEWLLWQIGSQKFEPIKGRLPCYTEACPTSTFTGSAPSSTISRALSCLAKTCWTGSASSSPQLEDSGERTFLLGPVRHMHHDPASLGPTSRCGYCGCVCTCDSSSVSYVQPKVQGIMHHTASPFDLLFVRGGGKLSVVDYQTFATVSRYSTSFASRESSNRRSSVTSRMGR